MDIGSFIFSHTVFNNMYFKFQVSALVLYARPMAYAKNTLELLSASAWMTTHQTLHRTVSVSALLKAGLANLRKAHRSPPLLSPSKNIIKVSRKVLIHFFLYFTVDACKGFTCPINSECMMIGNAAICNCLPQYERNLAGQCVGKPEK